jgi:hypothetical protein
LCQIPQAFVRARDALSVCMLRYKSYSGDGLAFALATYRMRLVDRGGDPDCLFDSPGRCDGLSFFLC